MNIRQKEKENSGIVEAAEVRRVNMHVILFRQTQSEIGSGQISSSSYQRIASLPPMYISVLIVAINFSL